MANELPLRIERHRTRESYKYLVRHGGTDCTPPNYEDLTLYLLGSHPEISLWDHHKRLDWNQNIEYGDDVGLTDMQKKVLEAIVKQHNILAGIKRATENL